MSDHPYLSFVLIWCGIMIAWYVSLNCVKAISKKTPVQTVYTVEKYGDSSDKDIQQAVDEIIGHTINDNTVTEVVDTYEEDNKITVKVSARSADDYGIYDKIFHTTEEDLMKQAETE